MHSGYVYLLSNPSMPNIFKIGRSENDPFKRAAGLSNCTAVPQEFKLCGYGVFDDCILAEKYLHKILKTHRVNRNREFFYGPIVLLVNAFLESSDILDWVDICSEKIINHELDEILNGKN